MCGYSPSWGRVSRIARKHLAESGAPGLSVRAIARELGLASSALYRYYPSRDALLTQLIVESYNELGDAVEIAAASWSISWLQRCTAAVGFDDAASSKRSPRWTTHSLPLNDDHVVS